ncbi:MAG TPA: hypothetical protein VFE46_08315 [Pirellulales bacterium]|nr:hypothetical protein [Pirellulales bacterium]
MNRIALAFALLTTPCLLRAGEQGPGSCEHCQDGECCACRCAHCGCEAHCQKTCHVVCEWKDVKEYVYACRCTDVCIPGRSEKGCTQIDECNPCNCPCLHDYKPLYTLWNPSPCAGIRSVNKLVKIEVTHKVPTYKWVVEYCCDKCNCDLTQQDAQLKALTENGPPVLVPMPVLPQLDNTVSGKNDAASENNFSSSMLQDPMVQLSAAIFPIDNQTSTSKIEAPAAKTDPPAPDANSAPKPVAPLSSGSSVLRALFGQRAAFSSALTAHAANAPTHVQAEAPKVSPRAPNPSLNSLFAVPSVPAAPTNLPQSLPNATSQSR